jgi:hypothetical protein
VEHHAGRTTVIGTGILIVNGNRRPFAELSGLAIHLL